MYNEYQALDKSMKEPPKAGSTHGRKQWAEQAALANHAKRK